MTGTPSITVRRQVVEADVLGRGVDALALHRRLAALCREQVPAALEAALGPIDPGDVHLSVDRLELEVRVTSIDGLETELAEGVQRGVEEFLRRHAVLAADDGVARRSAGEAVDEALVEFLRTGRLPWWFSLAAGTSLEEHVLEAWDGSGPDAAGRRAGLLREVFADPVARQRAVAQFTGGFLETVLRAVAPHLPVGAVRGLADRRLWAAALGAATSGDLAAEVRSRLGPAAPFPSAERSPRAGQRSGRSHSPTEPEMGTSLRDGPVGSSDEGAPRAPAPADVPSPPERPGPGDPDIRSGSAGPSPTTARRPVRPADRRPPEQPGTQPPALDLPKGSPPEAMKLHDGILVEHAGMVLLYPFLPPFLEILGVVDDNQVIDPNRAVCLLHLLATGERIAPEHRVTVAKVLCGVPLEAVVSSDVGISDDDVDEADALLRAVIGHWGALGGTTPDGVRGEFLMRPGLLALQPDHHWLLRVEPATSDILLARLPWGISMASLPWLQRPLRVEWG